MERLTQPIDYARPEGHSVGPSEIRDFLQRRWKVIGGTALLFLTLTVAVTFAVTPVYSGSAELLLETPRETIPGMDAVSANLILSSAVVESQLAILKSKSLLTRVVNKMALDKDPEFGPSDDLGLIGSVLQYIPATWKSALFGEAPPPLRDPVTIAVSNLWDAVTIARTGQSNVIRITVSSSSAPKAVNIANTLAQSYLLDQVQARYDRAVGASDWLNARQQVLQGEVSRSEAAVEEFRTKNNLIGTPSGSLTEQQLTELNTALIKARAETSAKRSSFDQVQKLLATGGEVQTNPDILKSGAVAELRAKLNAIGPQEAEIRSRYGERHPEFLKLQAERRVIEEQLKGEVEQAIANMRSDLEGAEWRETSMAKSLLEVSGQSGVDNQVAVRLRELERVAAANKQIYESFLSRAKIAEEETTLPTTEARIISAAAIPDSPDFPRTKLFAAMGMIMGLGLGTGLAVLLEMLRPGFMANRQVQEVLNLPVLASVPRMRSWEHRTDGPAPELLEDLSLHPFSRYTEAIRTLRFSIDAFTPIHESLPRVVQITSTMPGEGKTTLAISLACSAAAAGETVLLVDADLRLSSASRIFEKRNELGLVDVLTSSADIQEAIHFDEKLGIYLLPAGARAQNPPALLDSDRMQKLMAYAKTSFDRVIIDSPPVAVAVDAAVISRAADSIVFAVKWSNTPREAVSQAIAQLRRSDRVAGIVLTMVEDQKLPRHGRYLSLDSKIVEKYGYAGSEGYVNFSPEDRTVPASRQG